MLTRLLLLLFAIGLVQSRNDYSAEALKDQVVNLPGAPKNSTWKLFSGYIEVDPTNGRNLFYVFVESANNPSTDPVVFWTNGGPGCSGLLGFFIEHGPLLVNADLTLRNNPYAWANVANVLYVEIPAGVGFSYSNTPSDYTTGDNKTAADNYKMIQMFLEKFSNYANSTFYITSESYGGHYMPTLAKAIVDGNKAGGSPQINFGGFLVGNPFTDPVENAKGAYDTWYGHQLLPKPLHDQWVETCNDGETQNAECSKLEQQMSDLIGNLDPYNLDYPVCTKQTAEKYWFIKKVLKEGLGRSITIPPYDPCGTTETANYLNMPAVQTALHVKPTKWTMCSDKVNYSGQDMNNPMEPIYKYLIDGNTKKLKFTIFSGDDDSVCGTLGTQSWIWDLGYEANKLFTWRVWYLNKQVSGYTTKFLRKDGSPAFSFITVHSAGHQVPMTQPARGLAVLEKYLAGELE